MIDVEDRHISTQAKSQFNAFLAVIAFCTVAALMAGCAGLMWVVYKFAEILPP